MRTSKLGLEIRETCAGEGTMTVEGKAPHPFNLEALNERAETLFDRVMLSERLGVLYLIKNGVTLQLYRDGGLVVNRVDSIAAAADLLSPLLDQ